MDNTKIYEPELGLNGTIPQLVDWANRYTNDYSNSALLRISELAEKFKLGEKYVQIPILLLNERMFEDNDETINAAYSRLCIDHYLGNRISLSMSNYGEEGRELEIYEENGKVIIHLCGTDGRGTYSAANSFTVEEFMAGETNWLKNALEETLFYGIQYDEEVNA